MSSQPRHRMWNHWMSRDSRKACGSDRSLLFGESVWWITMWSGPFASTCAGFFGGRAPHSARRCTSGIPGSGGGALRSSGSISGWPLSSKPGVGGGF